MPKAKRKKRAQRERLHREPIVRRVAELLATGTPTAWRFTSEARHGLRAGFCLKGMTWEAADKQAAAIVVLARHRIGLSHFPTWSVAQGDPPEEVEYSYCRGCGGFMGASSRPWCSEICQGNLYSRRHRSRHEELARLEATRIILTGGAERQSGYNERPCRHCDKVFKPVSIRQRYCSLPCSRAHSRRPPRACLVCAEVFLPKHKTGLYCSRVCCDEHWRRRALQQRALQRQRRTCQWCGAGYKPTNNLQMYCSDPCKTKVDNAQRRERARQARLREAVP